LSAVACTPCASLTSLGSHTCAASHRQGVSRASPPQLQPSLFWLFFADLLFGLQISVALKMAPFPTNCKVLTTPPPSFLAAFGLAFSRRCWYTRTRTRTRLSRFYPLSFDEARGRPFDSPCFHIELTVIPRLLFPPPFGSSSARRMLSRQLSFCLRGGAARRGGAERDVVVLLTVLLAVTSTPVFAEFHLAPRGALTCDYGDPVVHTIPSNPGPNCVAATRVILDRIIGNSWNPEVIAWDEGRNGDNCGDGAWGDVPPDCSIQTTATSIYTVDGIGKQYTYSGFRPHIRTGTLGTCNVRTGPLGETPFYYGYHFQMVCSGYNATQEVTWHLAPDGAGSCDFGRVATLDECKTASPGKISSRKECWTNGSSCTRRWKLWGW
jgi:hypothetical protein